MTLFPHLYLIIFNELIYRIINLLGRDNSPNMPANSALRMHKHERDECATLIRNLSLILDNNYIFSAENNGKLVISLRYVFRYVFFSYFAR